jgi:hypothetical protein
LTPVRLTRLEALREVLNGFVLIGEWCARLVMQPSKLLQDFGVVGLVSQYPHVRISGVFVLSSARTRHSHGESHVSVLLIDVPKLEPDVPRCERARRVLQDIFEALASVEDNGIDIVRTSRLAWYLR